MPIPLPERPVFIILLAQGGEFGFVVFQAAAQAGVIDAPISSLLVAAVAISMLLTPLLLVAADRWLAPQLAQRTAQPAVEELNEPQDAPVIIAGFGRYGQIVGRLLYANGIAPTVLDHDAEQIEALRKFGWRVFYGDATRLDLLRTAGAAKRAHAGHGHRRRRPAASRSPKMARENFPQLDASSRAHATFSTTTACTTCGVRLIERETFDSALMSARSVLETLGWQPHQARNLALRFRRHNVEQLERWLPHSRTRRKLIAAAKQGRQQLEELFALEREQARERQARAGWSGTDESLSLEAEARPNP